MGLVIREIIGWVLVAIGLALIGVVLVLALQRSVLEALALAFPSAIVFRAGISLVRLATAARIATQIAQDSVRTRSISRTPTTPT